MTLTEPPSYQFLDDNLDTSPIALRLFIIPTSPQQTPQTTPQATPQTTPPTPLPTPSPLNTTLPPNTPTPNTLPPQPPPLTSKHPMVTCFTTSSPIPKSLFYALRDSNWKQAKCDEYKALIDNETWVLVPCPPNVNIVRSMWLYKHKYNADGSLSRYKTRLVANGRSQQQGIDCDETFSLVVKPATIRTVLILAVSRQWHIHQLDVKNAFLHGHLTETIYMHQPPGFRLLQRIISSLHSEFSMTDLGPLNYFLGISATRTPTVDTEKKPGPDGPPVTDPTLYRSLAGALQYLTFTRPDLSYAVQQLCLYMHDPREPHLAALKRVLRYIRGTTDLGLQLYQSSTSQLISYTDADWAGCPATRCSTSSYYVFLGDNLLSWSSKSQHTLSRSSAEAEYRGVANVVAETAWIRNLLRELQAPLFTATLVYSSYSHYVASCTIRPMAHSLYSM
ncbi:ribonuclease H-like domain-containing protein [Tanacetum coccineum]